jgi:hypothetical protein
VKHRARRPFTDAAAALALALALGAAGPGAPRAETAPAQKVETPESLETLGSLERQAVDEALAARALVVDRAPQGKLVGQIHVYNHPVFSGRDGHFQLLNIFHRTTREYIIRREVLLQPGDAFDAAIADETVRNLRDAEFSSLVVIVPVVSAEAGKVDLLVVTRDVWSLRFNTDFQFDEGGRGQESVLIYLTTSLSENNLFGWRKRASLAFNLYRGSYEIGPTYFDPNVAGTRLRFSASYFSTYDRDSRQREGHSLGARLEYPLWSLARKWGAYLTASHADLVFRRYQPFGRGLLLVDLASTPEMEMLPIIYRYRRASEEVGAVRSFAFGPFIHRVNLSQRVSVIRPRFHERFPSDDPALRAAYQAALFPISERFSALALSYSLFQPRYRVYRNFDTYDLREDSQLGPTAYLYADRAAALLGSDRSSTGVSAAASWSLDLGDGYQRLWASWGGRVRDGRFGDESRATSFTLATPVLARAVRVVASGSLTVQLRNTRPDSYYTLGNEDGLRGYGVAQFQGQARYIAHLEARSTPLALFALRAGAVAFYDVGHAAASMADLLAYNDAGVGLRLLIPQLNFYVLRVDWAFPFQRSGVIAAGWPGRVTAGFRQGF